MAELEFLTHALLFLLLLDMQVISAYVLCAPSKGTNTLAVRTTNSVLYLRMTLIINALPMIGVIF